MSTTEQKTLVQAATKTRAKKTPVTKNLAVKPMASKKPIVKKVTTVKQTAKPVTKPTTQTTVKKAPLKTTDKPVKAAKFAKVKKPKLVRDSFTIPKDEYVVIDNLKLRAGKLGQPVKKSELLRAGIKALAAMSDIQFKAALSNVPTIKTGRPKNVK